MSQSFLCLFPTEVALHRFSCCSSKEVSVYFLVHRGSRFDTHPFVALPLVCTRFWVFLFGFYVSFFRSTSFWLCFVVLEKMGVHGFTARCTSFFQVFFVCFLKDFGASFRGCAHLSMFSRMTNHDSSYQFLFSRVWVAGCQQYNQDGREKHNKISRRGVLIASLFCPWIVFF